MLDMLRYVVSSLYCSLPVYLPGNYYIAVLLTSSLSTVLAWLFNRDIVIVLVYCCNHVGILLGYCYSEVVVALPL